jgi:hypothetical protein
VKLTYATNESTASKITDGRDSRAQCKTAKNSSSKPARPWF